MDRRVLKVAQRVIDYPGDHPAIDLPRRSLSEHIASRATQVALVDRVAGDPATASSSTAPEDVHARAAALLPYKEVIAPVGDVLMEESMGALGIVDPQGSGEVEMRELSRSPHPRPRDREDFDEPASGFM